MNTTLSLFLDTLAADFARLPDTVKLEIPLSSLRKAAEDNLPKAESDYEKLIATNNGGLHMPSFEDFYAPYALSGLSEYAHRWHALLEAAGGGSCCGGH